MDRRWFAARMSGRGAGHPLTVQVEGEAVRILRQFEAPPGNQPNGFRIQLDRTYRRFGGSRWWLISPRPDCGRRGDLVYPAGGEFNCRRCLALAYELQRENRRFRALRRAQKIRVRLGGSTNVVTPLP